MTRLHERYLDGRYLAETQGAWHEADSPWKADQIARMIDRAALRPRTILEIGCGAGGVLAHLQRRLPPDARLVGYDISPQAVLLAERHQNERLSFKNEDPLQIRSDPYDLVLLIDVIEHVPDYLGFLDAVRRLGKHFIFHIPLDLSALSVLRGWPILRRRKSVGHLHYFIAPTALATLEDCRFAIAQTFYTASGFVPPARGWKAAFFDLPNRLAFRLSHEWTARALGRYSLMVCATPV